MKYTKLSSKRQLTLTREQLDLLGVSANSRVMISFERGALVIRPATRTIVDETAGVFKNVLPESKYALGLETLKTDTKKRVSQKLSSNR